MKNKWISGLLFLAILISLCMADTQTVQAKAKVKKLNLNYNSVTMQKGSKLTLRITSAYPAGVSKKVTWKSSNKKVVSINKKGVLAAKKTGTATITAKAKSGGKTVKCKVKVTKRQKTRSKLLIAYFSATGTTEKIVKKIEKATGATLYQITPAKKYTSEDLNYNNDRSRADKEQNNKKSRPSIKGKAVNMKDYDTVIIAYPIWHGQAPRIISTFLESYDFSGKTIVPLCTSHSSGIGSSARNLSSLCAKSAVWREGKRFDGDASEEAVKKWLEGIL